jgi:hypothetical protein
MSGAASCGAASCGAGRKGPHGTGQDRVWSYERSGGRSVWSRMGPGCGHEWFLSLSPRLAVFNASFSSLSLDLIHS